jgi:hypothetical protein
MSDLETDFLESLEKSSHLTQTGPLNEPSLSQLRDQIKKVMIPLLIKTFQLKLELTQSLSLPSRLQNQSSHRSPKEILDQLKTLDNDLKGLLLWCQSCRSQIHKALTIPEDEKMNTVTTPPSDANPAVARSFNEAIAAQSSFFQQQPTQEKEKDSLTDPLDASPQKTWWDKLLGH